jgi:hypothetical protein
MTHLLLRDVESQAERLRLSRPGIADFAMRQHRHLGAKLDAAHALPAGAWRDAVIKATEAQLSALLAELSRLSAPAPGTPAYEHGGAP